MDELARFETFMEGLMEGSLVRLLRSQLQPVEIAKKLARAMEDGRTIGAGKIFVPNRYQVLLNRGDFSHFEPFQASLERELAAYLTELADRRGFTLVGKPRVTLQPREDVPRNHLRIQAQLVDAEEITAGVSAEPSGRGLTEEIRREEIQAALAAKENLVLAVEGREIALDKPLLTLGRSLDNDVVLDDRRVSRHHAHIKRRYGKYCLYDLGSVNGTFVNGQRIDECVLRQGDLISLGGIELVFRRRASSTGDALAHAS